MQELDLFGNPIEVPESRSVQFDPTEFGERDDENDFIPPATVKIAVSDPPAPERKVVEPEKVIALNAQETALVIQDAPSSESQDEPTQNLLFEKGEWWENEYKGMPAFVQKDLEPFKTIYVHFENRKEMEAFAKLVGQRITLDTRAIWYPEADVAHVRGVKYYVDEKDPYIQTTED